MTSDLSELTPASDTGEILVPSGGRLLTREEFQGLADVPPEVTWFADIRNPNTKRAYANDVAEFRRFLGIEEVNEFRIVTRAHVLAWRKDLECRGLSAATIRRKLSAVSSLFDSLCEANAINQNPVSGVSRPKEGANVGKTPAISDEQAKRYLDAPDPDQHKAPSRRLKAWRDRAIVSTLAFHGLRVSELIDLAVKDIAERRGVKFFTLHRKGGKIAYVPIHPHTLRRIEEYLAVAGHDNDREAVMFQSVRSRCRKLDQSSVFKDVVRKYALQAGVDPMEVCTHSFRVTAATNALENGATIEQVKEWYSHSSIATTDMYNRMRHNPEDSPTFRVRY